VKPVFTKKAFVPPEAFYFLEHFQSKNALGRVNAIEFLFSGKKDASAIREYTLTVFDTEMADTHCIIPT
jgi:hypothetical protein